MDVPSKEFLLAGSLEELKAKGRLVLHGSHRPILVIYDRGRVFALDNRCPHLGSPLERGSVEDRLPWSAYDGSHIRLRQSKTGARVSIPVGAPLKAALDDAARTKQGPIILASTDRQSWTSDGFRSSWGKA